MERSSALQTLAEGGDDDDGTEGSDWRGKTVDKGAAG